MKSLRFRASRYCTICGAPAAPDSTFCKNCGKVIEVPTSAGAMVVYCHECGSETSLSDAYCAKCGAPQPPNAKPPARAPEVALEQPAVRVEMVRNSDPGFVVRIVWFIFVGLWLGMVVTTFAWLAIVSVIGLPVGLWLVNHIPAIITLRSPTTVLQLRSGEDGKLVVSQERPLQLPFQTRAVYFVAVGWWLSLVWLVLAYVMAIMIIPLPVAMWMWDQLPAITTLERY